MANNWTYPGEYAPQRNFGGGNRNPPPNPPPPTNTDSDVQAAAAAARKQQRARRGRQSSILSDQGYGTGTDLSATGTEGQKTIGG